MKQAYVLIDEVWCPVVIGGDGGGDGGGTDTGAQQKWFRWEVGDLSNGWEVADWEYIIAHRTGGLVTVSGILDGSSATDEIFLYWGNYACQWAIPSFHAYGFAIDSTNATRLVYPSGYTPGLLGPNPDPPYYEFTGLAVRGGVGVNQPLHFSITYSTKRNWDDGGPNLLGEIDS